MPQVVLTNTKRKDARAKDPSLNAKLGPFLAKLQASSDTAGMHVEPINGTQDPRVRTARVDNFYRAVLFQMREGADAVYVFHGVWPHDDAIAEAKRVTLKVNPRSGATEILEISQDILDEQASVERAQQEAEERLAAARERARQLEAEAARSERANAAAARDLAGAAEASTPVGGGAGGGAAATTDPAALPAGAVRVPSQARPLQWPDGMSVETLRDELGIEVGLAAAALRAGDESALLDLAASAPVPWQGEALLSLATGAGVEDVRRDFELQALDQTKPGDEGATDPAAEDEDLLAGLRTRAARSMFTWVEKDEDLRKAIEDLDFHQWQLFLHPHQRVLVERHTNGAVRVSGGAGTGKTVVAVHRAAWLASQDAQAGEPVRILLTTYTRNLVDDLRRQLSQLDPTLPLTERFGEEGILVKGLDSLATTILQKAGDAVADVAEVVLGRRRTRVLSTVQGDPWRDAAAAAGADLPEPLRSSDFLASEYHLVVLPQRITTLRDYLRVRRPGRGVALDRTRRAAVWKAMEAYRDRSAALDVTTFEERLALAAAWLDARAEEGQPRPFRHVLVDEGQDLTPTHLQLLRALVAEGPDDLFIAEDSHQRIYGKKIVLSHYGIHVRGRSRRLTRNYRTTRQNLDLAFGILEPGQYEDLEGGTEEHHYLSPRSGPDPVLLPAKDRAGELDAAKELLQMWLAEDAQGGESTDAGDSPVAGAETIAVLVRDKYVRDNVVSGLAERGLEVRAVDRDAVGRGRPVVMTMHRAKGLEFRKVLLFDVSEAAIPRVLREQDYSEADVADAMLRERSLLYVAATRARDQLAISWSGKASPLLEGVA